jgi:hypothetical protein
MYIFCKKANWQSGCIQTHANIFVQWREPLIIEKKQCIIKKQFRQVVVLKTDENNFVECLSMSLKFIQKE